MVVTIEFTSEIIDTDSYGIIATVTSPKGILMAEGLEEVDTQDEVNSPHHRAKAVLHAFTDLPLWAQVPGESPEERYQAVRNALTSRAQEVLVLGPRDDGRDIIQIQIG